MGHESAKRFIAFSAKVAHTTLRAVWFWLSVILFAVCMYAGIFLSFSRKDHSYFVLGAEIACLFSPGILLPFGIVVFSLIVSFVLYARTSITISKETVRNGLARYQSIWFIYIPTVYAMGVIVVFLFWLHEMTMAFEQTKTRSTTCAC